MKYYFYTFFQDFVFKHGIFSGKYFDYAGFFTDHSNSALIFVIEINKKQFNDLSVQIKSKVEKKGEK